MSAESELIARCLKGEADAWDSLFDAHYAAAGAFICQLSPALLPDDIEEITQETFLAVIRNLGQFHANSSFRTWLCRIAANKARDFLDRQSAAKRGGGETPFSLDAENPETGTKLDLPSAAPAPDFALMNEERMVLVRESLDALGDPCREIIELRYFADLSYEEIAGSLQMNPKTVSSRLSKCLDKLQAIATTRLAREKISPNPV